MLTNKRKRLFKKICRNHQADAPHRIHRTLKRRWRVWALIKEFEHEGKIYHVESGRDCDGVQYSGHIHSCAAHPWAYEALLDRISDSADGPFHLDMIKYEDLHEVEYTSRDLTLEAFENGHPHYLTSAY